MNNITKFRADSLEDLNNLIQEILPLAKETNKMTETIQPHVEIIMPVVADGPILGGPDESCTTTAKVDLELIRAEEDKDGSYYLKLLDENTALLNGLCQNYYKYTDQSNTEFYVTIEDSLGEIQTSIGKAQLLINQKFKQFRGLCVKNLRDKSNEVELKEGEFVTLDADLAGFWDMVCLQIEDIQRLFLKLDEMKANNWEIIRKPITKTKIENKKPVLNNCNNTKKVAGMPYVVASKKNTDASRQRLIEAKKRAAALKSKNQNNDIEIFE